MTTLSRISTGAVREPTLHNRRPFGATAWTSVSAMMTSTPGHKQLPCGNDMVESTAVQRVQPYLRMLDAAFRNVQQPRGFTQ